MNKFTRKTEGYELFPAYVAFKTFFDTYFIERNIEKTLSFVDEDVYSFGAGIRKNATDKAAFTTLIQAELEVIKEPINYKVNNITGKEIAENIWNIFAELETMLTNSNGENLRYEIQFTGSFIITKEGFVVTSIHLSKAGSMAEVKEMLSLKYVDAGNSIDKGKTEQIVFDIMSQAIPGGVVSGYAEDGFPLYFVNEKYLKLLGYDSYDEYYKDANGLGVSHIHPDDKDMVNRETMHSYSTNSQYGIEYRIRHKKGHYIHVYDIGRKMTTPEGKEVIVCVLYDMTEDVKLRNVLMHEANYDALTGLYNRRGVDHKLEQLFSKTKELGHSAMVVIDADGLKGINDTYGHEKGDIYLEEIAAILGAFGAKRSVASRQGGDEFVLFLYGYKSKKKLMQAIEILQDIQNNNTVHLEDDLEVPLKFSMGWSLTGDEKDYRRLIKEADKKMYKNKLERREHK